MNDISECTVFILAAGAGTRLRPLTDVIPKPMIPIGERPLLENTITLLRDQGFRNFVINLYYLPEKITFHFGDGAKFGVHIIYSDESEGLLETAGAIKKAETSLSDPFLLLYGDHLHRFDFRPLLAFHNENNALATVVLKTSDLPQNGDMVEIDHASKRIIGWHARPHSIEKFSEGFYLNTGFYVFSKKILDAIPTGRPVKLDAEVFPALLAAHSPLYGFPTDDPILDINTKEKYEFAKQWYLNPKA